jgi:hypothetical protein
MTISDETLMAFADGELDAAAREAVESAMRSDPEVQRRVARHRTLRARLKEAFEPELSEPVPERLINAARQTRSQPATVVNLKDVRDAAARRGGRPPPSWWQVGAIAASVLLGFGLAYLSLPQGGGDFVRGTHGSLVAGGRVAAALSAQLGADQAADSAVRVGISFLAKTGDYCRTFSMAAGQSSSGLACRSGHEWKIQALIQSAADAHDAGYRPAGSGIAPLILQAVEETRAGEPLDGAGEAEALRKHWEK